MFFRKKFDEAKPVASGGQVQFVPRKPIRSMSRESVIDGVEKVTPAEQERKYDESIDPASNDHLVTQPVNKAPTRALGASVVINTIGEFATLPLPFEGLMDLQLGDHLAFNVRPAIFGGPVGSKAARAAILVNKTYANSDETAELIALLNDPQRSARVPLWEHATRIILSDQLLLALTRGELNKDGLSNRRKIRTDKRRHSFFEAFNDIVTWGFRENASDIHYNLNFRGEFSQIHFTIKGRYVAPEKFRMPTQTLLQILNVAWMEGTGGAGAYFDTRIEQQCRINLEIDGQEIMLRWASASTEYPGPSVTTRIVKISESGTIPSLEKLTYLPGQIATTQRAQNAEKGAVIYVGVVGSGKSLSIASTMSRIPAYRKKLSIEDPVEIIVPGMLQKSINRPLEGDTGHEFDAIAKTAKRFAMNDILIGEIRDAPTGALLVDVVLMGTSVYTTTHAPSALGAFDKLASDMVGISKDFLSTPGNIKLITYQALLPKLCECCLPFKLIAEPASSQYSDSGAEYIKRIDRLYDVDQSLIRIRNPQGCEKCRHDGIPELNGFIGVTLAAEQIEPDDMLLSLVKRSDSIGMRRHVAELRGTTPFNSPDMTGKTAMECAVYKMTRGELDPREIEPRFHSFEREEMIRASNRLFTDHIANQRRLSVAQGATA